MADGYFSPKTGMLAGFTVSYGTYDAYIQKVSLVGSDGSAISFGGSGASAQQVQGAGAHAATTVGYPVVAGGMYLSSTPTLTNGQTGGLQVDTRSNVKASIFDANGTTGLSIVAASADGVAAASATGLAARAMGYQYNGTSWDRAAKPNATSRVVSAAASTNATSAKASAGNVFSVSGYNANAAARYLKIYNKATAPTVGTDTPVWTEYLAPQAKFELRFAVPLYLGTGIAYALTTGVADNDTGALTAADIVALNMAYS